MQQAALVIVTQAAQIYISGSDFATKEILRIPNNAPIRIEITTKLVFLLAPTADFTTS